MWRKAQNKTAAADAHDARLVVLGACCSVAPDAHDALSVWDESVALVAKSAAADAHDAR